MNSADNSGSNGRAALDQGRLTLGWALSLIAGQAVGAAIALSFLFAVLGAPFREFWVPFFLLAWCGVPLPAMFLWIRAAKPSSRSYAVRSAVTCYVWLGLIATALSLGAIHLGLDSARDVARTYAPATALILVGVAVWAYLQALRRGSGDGSAHPAPTGNPT